MVKKEPLLLPAIQEKGFDLGQGAAPGIRPAHTIMFLAFSYNQVISFFDTITGNTQAKLFSKGITRDVGTMLFKVPTQIIYPIDAAKLVCTEGE